MPTDTMSTPIPEDYVRRIAFLFEVYAGLKPPQAEAFVEAHLATQPSEHRFMGSLGTGGKFYNVNGRWYVATYPDEETPGRRVIIDLLNVKLAHLRRRLESGRPAWLCECSTDSGADCRVMAPGRVVPPSAMEKTFFEGVAPVDFTVGHATTMGPRERQEDAAALSLNRFAVFDGLGGHGGGDQASRAAAQAFAEYSGDDLTGAIDAAQAAVLKVQRSTAWCRDAATTAASVEIGTKLKVCWSGDSRVYVYRRRRSKGQRLVLLTQDHNISRHRLAACLGLTLGSMAEHGTVNRNKGDILVLTTDGLHEYIKDMEAVITLNAAKGPQVVADELVKAALAFPTQDNATTIVVFCK